MLANVKILIVRTNLFLVKGYVLPDMCVHCPAGQYMHILGRTDQLYCMIVQVLIGHWWPYL